MDYSLLGKRIKQERLKLNLTQEKLAEAIDISDTYMSQIERGGRGITLENLIKLANKLGTTVDYLISDSLEYTDDIMLREFQQLFAGKTDSQKQLLLDVVKTILSHIEKGIVK